MTEKRMEAVQGIEHRVTVSKAASVLGVARPTLSRVINGRAAVSAEMAIRLSKAFGSRPEAWLRMRLAYDLARTLEMASQIKVKRYKNATLGIHDEGH